MAGGLLPLLSALTCAISNSNVATLHLTVICGGVVQRTGGCDNSDTCMLWTTRGGATLLVADLNVLPSWHVL